MKSLKSAGRATAKATKWTIAHWRGLLPVLCAGGAGLFAAITHLLMWAVDGWEAKALVAAVGVVLFVWADGWVGQLHVTQRPPAIAFVLFTTASAIALILVPDVRAVYMAIIVADLAIGTWWWNGAAYQSFKTTQRAQRKMETILRKLGISSATRITSVGQNKRGDLEWRLYLGDSDRPDQLKSADVAHMLKVETSRVIVRRVDGDSTRQVKIVLLARALKKAMSVDHPAALPGGRDAGSPWAPGARRVAMGAPLGPRADNPDQVITFHLYEPGYGARHNLIAGVTGSGKSVTISSILAHCAASTDCVMAGVDLMKGGETFMPWDEAGTMVSHLYIPAEQAADDTALLAAAEQLLKELTWLRTEVARRTAAMASGQVLDTDGERTRVWPATEADPVIAYFFEEYATTISTLSKLDEDLAGQIEETVNDIGKTARSSGISINIVTQRAALDELPPTLRAQLSQTIMHKLNSSNDRGKLWEEYDIDPVRTLAAGKGLCYADQPGGEDPALLKAYNLSKPKTCSDIGTAYAATQPDIGWAGTTTPDRSRQTEVGALNLLADAFDDELPANAPIIGGDLELSETDQGRLTVIIKALADAEEPLRRADIEKHLGLKMSATKILLTALIDDGQVVMEGKGKAARYRLAKELANA